MNTWDVQAHEVPCLPIEFRDIGCSFWGHGVHARRHAHGGHSLGHVGKALAQSHPVRLGCAPCSRHMKGGQLEDICGVQVMDSVLFRAS